MNEPMNNYRMVPLASIKIPELRVTSVMDEDMMREITDSIRSQGILQPLQVEDIEGELWLIDGLHRMMAARDIGLTEVPCMVTRGTTEGVLVKNLVVNRQRGKTNPAEEAQLIRSLMENGDIPLEKIARVSGLSVGWTRKLYDLAFLPPSVLGLVAIGKLGITHALELLALKDETMQKEVAEQAVSWRYTVEQVKIRVATLLQPAFVPSPGSTQFDSRGAPSRVPILCFTCRRDMGDAPSYVFICGDCQQMTVEFYREYQALVAADAVRAPPAPAPLPTPAPAGGEKGP